ncbi:MAG: hypothetical protein NC338_00365 [Firmicutes bacterium]|nr:hypothetical protein [Bacillota bacterium]MCM1400733.1 hypothetical protein [Bacteroides sp.]MCM1476848.1 hypothetical protein [Bacteroides sp.]
MKIVQLMLLLLPGLAFAAGARQLGNEYRLKRVIEIPGRQGVACDGKYYFVSDTKALYKLDKDGNVVHVNREPFKNPEVANHFGDIDYHNGEIYCGLEKFEYGRGKNISVAIYDANTLQWKRNLPWSPESGQVEVSGLAVDRDRNMVWMSDWVDSRYVYCYDLSTGAYHTKMQCQPAPYWCQGIYITDGKMLFSADDGEAQYNIPDNLYVVELDEVPFTGLVDGEEPKKDTPFSVEIDVLGKPVMRKGKVAGGAMKGKVRHFREMGDFKRAGEIEGLAIDPSNGDLLVVNNRGTKIVLGMSQGPLTDEGYDREIHELYIYERVNP